MNTPEKIGGFTLIELLMAMVIVAILVAFAFPSYQEYVERSRRQEAAGALLENAQFMERLYTQRGSYVIPAGVTLPRPSTKNYTIAVASTGTTFQLTASPMAGYTDTKCGFLGLNQLGQKTAGVAGQEEYCWQR